MAKRSLRHKNLFLNTLKNNTLAYIEAENKAVKEQLRQVVVNTKAEVRKAVGYPFYALKKQGVVRYYHKGKQVKEGNSKFGQVYTDTYKLVPTVSNAAMMAANEYMQKIFDKSQDLVPIDKRYNAINIKDKNTVYVKSFRRRPIIDITGYGKWYNSRKQAIDASIAGNYELMLEDDPSLKNFRRLKDEDYNTQELDILYDREQTRRIEAGYGWYGGRRGEFIKKYLSGTNTKGSYNLFYDNDTGLIMQRKSRGSYEFTPATGISLKMKGRVGIDPTKTVNVKDQPSFGYQELKSGGVLKQKGLNSIIEYNAFDETKPVGDRYNYAALQHDNLAFKHKYGQSLYLSDAVMMYRKQMLEAVKKASINAFNRGK